MCVCLYTFPVFSYYLAAACVLLFRVIIDAI